MTNWRKILFLCMGGPKTLIFWSDDNFMTHFLTGTRSSWDSCKLSCQTSWPSGVRYIYIHTHTCRSGVYGCVLSTNWIVLYGHPRSWVHVTLKSIFHYWEKTTMNAHIYMCNSQFYSKVQLVITGIETLFFNGLCTYVCVCTYIYFF